MNTLNLATNPLTVDDAALSQTVVALVSEDGVEFPMDLQTVCLSKTLAMFLDPQLGFRESQTRRVSLTGIPAKTLKRVCEYLEHRRKWDGCEQPPHWDIAVEESLDLLLVADYLEI